MKILTIVGARPQFVKAAMVSKAIKKHPGLKERVLHTGQHYNPEMSKIFFDQLKIPKPYKNLKVGSGPQGQQTARMIEGIERECLKEKPDGLLIYGDTNSTTAGALAASKLHIPIAHVEAGLRSFNRAMPEEINRIISDRLSTLLFAPTSTAVSHLKKEGITKGVHRTGDVMIDAIYFFRDKSRSFPKKIVNKVVPTSPYFLLTLHRAENTDNLSRLRSILRGLATSPYPIIFPMHPRTAVTLVRAKIKLPKTIQAIEPVSYLEMVLLQDRAETIWTDSGGVQKEAVVLGKRCYTLRDETEWTETVDSGWNQLLGANQRKIESVLKNYLKPKNKLRPFPTRKFYGDGHASEKIARILTNY